MSADETSERIKRVALERFAEVGFGSTTIDQIASGAGVGVATLYRRWPDKSALANALVVDYLNAFDAILTPVDGGTRKSRFFTLWQRLWDLAAADPALLLFVEAQASAGFMTEEVAAHKAEVVKKWVDSIGDFGIEADPFVAASMMIGSITNMRRGGVPLDRDELAERLWTALRSR